ncbi:uncharacterized protein BP5553_00746 [Venustampulla echinocandica]|uniref:DUF7587 domain-containing protein n=1 Tax=Venustampulla echinocandica TaxID=2656787 RepID=A0A370TZ10_9HELO|nr:uncharacterized protein BP5553_00746 [Venustampulla echinocandica]RDL40767.1 hypothetical protein BP5553_00746 [Venustampulla echinocandica]
MDYDWTQKSKRPRYLFRVITPFSNTTWVPKVGFIAGDLASSYSKTVSMNLFLASVDAHRNGYQIASPYISCFADINEAESWTLGAGQLYGNENCYMAWFDTTHEKLRNATMWLFEDIQKKSASIASNYPQFGKLEVPMRPLCAWPVNSEWLILRTVPDEAMVGCTLVSGILAARARSMPPSQHPQLPLANGIIHRPSAAGARRLPGVLIPPFADEGQNEQFLDQMFAHHGLAFQPLPPLAYHEGHHLHPSAARRAHSLTSSTPKDPVQDHIREHLTEKNHAILQFLLKNPDLGSTVLLDLVRMDLALSRRALMTLVEINPPLDNHKAMDIMRLAPDMGNRAFMNLIQMYPVQSNLVLMNLILTDPALCNHVATYLLQRGPARRNCMPTHLQRMDPALADRVPTHLQQMDPSLGNRVPMNVVHKHQKLDGPMLGNRGQEHHKLNDPALINHVQTHLVQKQPSLNDPRLDSRVQSHHKPEIPAPSNHGQKHHRPKNPALLQTPLPQVNRGNQLAELAKEALQMLDENY